MQETVIKELTQEEVDEMMDGHLRVVMTLGFLTFEAYEDFKYHAAEGMMRFGGEFTRRLGHALVAADIPNAIKLIKLYWSMCDEHAMLHKIFIAKRDAGVLEDE